jgi:hypothetical protein
VVNYTDKREENNIMKFELTIALGNDTMRSGEDVAEVLYRVATRVEGTDADSGAIVDSNGNTVGSFAFIGQV